MDKGFVDESAHGIRLIQNSRQKMCEGIFFECEK